MTLMMSNHMAWGLFSGCFIGLFFAPNLNLTYPIVVPAPLALGILGMFGGALPDLDQLESLGFVHKKTCHFIMGYLAAAAVLLVGALLFPSFQLFLLPFACISLGAGLHSIMDIFDGFRDDNPAEGIYEHLTGRWLPSFHIVGFGEKWDWAILALAFALLLPTSVKITHIFPQGLEITFGAVFMIWIVSAVFDAFFRAPQRQLREHVQLERLRRESAQLK
jgi:hypothetical protein